MKLRIHKLMIERFRSIREISIGGLGRVNLITGRNNTGKSSLLESLRILASDASPAILWQILRNREENVADSDDPPRALQFSTGTSQISSLFPGFPPLNEMKDRIVIASNGGNTEIRLALSLGWFSEERDPEGLRRLVPQQASFFGEPDVVPALVVEGKSVRRVIPLENLRRMSARISQSGIPEEPRIPCVYVSPYGSEHTALFGPLWDKIALSDREHDVVEALRIIAPEIGAVSMVGGEGSRQPRIAIVKVKGFPRPVSLRSFGDGVNRLFGIVLSLANAKNGLLLIDEVENGMHHSIQSDLWRAIFRISERLNVQVFATSHSWDSIEAFQEAAADHPEDGVLVRLSRRGNEVIPTVFQEEELAVATRERIEVR